MQDTQPHIAYPAVLAKNGFTLFLFIGSITLTITAIYFSQTIFYSHRSSSKTGASLHKITGITRDDVFDLSGSEASGNGNPMKLFDEDADPANGSTAVPNTNPLPNSKMGIYYPPGKGLRIVVDLHDVYALSDFYIYDKALEADSVWLYTGEMNNWKLAAAYATGGHPAAWGWKNFIVHQPSRYVMIRFNSYKAIVSELVLYGNLQQKYQPITRCACLPCPNQPCANLPAPMHTTTCPCNYYSPLAMCDCTSKWIILMLIPLMPIRKINWR